MATEESRGQEKVLKLCVWGAMFAQGHWRGKQKEAIWESERTVPWVGGGRCRLGMGGGRQQEAEGLDSAGAWSGPCPVNSPPHPSAALGSMGL